MPHLQLEHVVASHGGTDILRGTSLAIERGEIVSLIGPSGSGKSTTLRAAIGLMPVSSGRITVEGHALDANDPESLRRIRAGMAMVFQHFGLFDHMSVLANLMLAPVKAQGRNRMEARDEALSLLRMLDLEGIGDRRPTRLSGGQKQRVAIARALMLRPRTLLLDEPTSALDPGRLGIVLDLYRHLAARGTTIIQVSHNMEAVAAVSDRIVLMEAGRVAAMACGPHAADDNEAVTRFMRHDVRA